MYPQFLLNYEMHVSILFGFPDSKVHVANMGPTWGRQDQGGPHVGPINLAIRVALLALRQSQDFPSDNEVSLTTVGKIDWYLITTKHNKA